MSLPVKQSVLKEKKLGGYFHMGSPKQIHLVMILQCKGINHQEPAIPCGSADEYA